MCFEAFLIMVSPFDRTIFTKTKRHNYVDPDYALNLTEEANKVNHRNSYVGMLRQMRQNRLNQLKSR